MITIGQKLTPSYWDNWICAPNTYLTASIDSDKHDEVQIIDILYILGALPAPPKELTNNFFNLGEGSSSSTTAPAPTVPYFIPLPGPAAIHYPSQDPSRMGASQRNIQQ